MNRRSSPRGRHARILVMATVLAVLPGWAPIGAGLGGVAWAADASSDIPGVPLPGPVAAGRLGGAIYDVVYRLVVPAGHVMIASLTGTPGTDFDLYLFDARATTVLSETGLLTKSNGPTSTEAISWPSPIGGTYYLDLNGATNIEGDYRLAVQVIADSTLPVASMVLAGGRPAINQLAVPLTLTASDDLSGIAEMAFSTDGSTFTPWQPFAATTSWTFAPGDGNRTLWAKVRNGVRIESAPISARITIDTLDPTATTIDPAPGATVSGLRPRISIAFDEPMDPSSWDDLGLIVQAANGPLVPGTYAYDPEALVGSFVPTAPVSPGAVYVVTIGNVTDLAGNRVSPRGSWTLIALSPTTLTASPSTTVVAIGGSVRIGVGLQGASLPAIVDVSAAPVGSTDFAGLATISYVGTETPLLVQPSRNTVYRFVYAGAFGVAPARKDVRILVRRSIGLVGRTSNTVARARVGSPVTLTAAVRPAAAGVSVSFRLYRFDAARRSWVYAGSRGRNTDASGRATYTWVPPASGSWYWRATVASTIDFANNTSSVYRWSVSR